MASHSLFVVRETEFTAAGCLIGGGLMTAYFATGGLLGSAWVNMVQLVVLLCGFAIVLPAALSHAGGLTAVMRSVPHEGFGAFWNGATSVSFLVLLVPAFISSPGLLQKAFGAESERAVRRGIGWNAVALFVFAWAIRTLDGKSGLDFFTSYPKDEAHFVIERNGPSCYDNDQWPIINADTESVRSSLSVDHCLLGIFT